MKKQELYNVLYQEKIIAKNISIEECCEIIEDFSEKYFSEKDINPNHIKVEKNYG